MGGERNQFIFFYLSLNLYIYYILISLYLNNLYDNILRLKRTHLLDISWPCYTYSRLLTRANSEQLRERKKLSEILMSVDPSISATKLKKISLFLSDFA